MKRTEETIEQFYTGLSFILCSAPTNDKIILLGNFNTHIDCNHNQWEGVHGKQDIGKMNRNSLLQQKGAEYELLITNTVFRLANKYMSIWMLPRSRQWHMID